MALLRFAANPMDAEQGEGGLQILAVTANIGEEPFLAPAPARATANFGNFRTGPRPSLRAAQPRGKRQFIEGNPVARRDCRATLVVTNRGGDQPR
jgi:hypothetical protein